MQLLYIEWRNSKTLLYSIENYSQYTGINHDGKEYEKKVYIYLYIYLYITESLYCTAEINTTLQINYI